MLCCFIRLGINVFTLSSVMLSINAARSFIDKIAGTPSALAKGLKKSVVIKLTQSRCCFVRCIIVLFLG
jgi:hypothetical protein